MVALSDELQRLIEDRMRQGGYASADDVIRAGLAMLEQQDRFEQWAPGELDALLAVGVADIEAGRVHDSEEVFREIAEMSEKRRREQHP
ncbi:MAG TPA: type II toxin-antitoxin system ParD family antitoxin [Tepidisphaeraceae bacterium]|nr:type II toxin-antitoxin system ParD family antitoxin [Tepidisphaeraceae bacterium]